MDHKNDHDFQTQVLKDLAVLKTQMYMLVGNGQPGRIQLLEDEVGEQGAWIDQQKGKSVVSSALWMALLAVLTSVGTAVAMKVLHL